MVWKTINGKRVYVKDRMGISIDDFRRAQQQDKSRIENAARKAELNKRKIVEKTTGYEVNIGLNPSIKIKKEMKETMQSDTNRDSDAHTG